MNWDYYCSSWAAEPAACEICGKEAHDKYCSDTCRYQGEKWSDAEILAFEQKKDLDERIGKMEQVYEMLLADERKDVASTVCSYKLTAEQLTDDILETLIQEGGYKFMITFPRQLQEWECMIRVVFDLSTLGYNGVEEEVYTTIANENPKKYLGVFSSREDYIKLIRNKEMLRQAILAAQDGRDSEDFKWVE